MELFINVLLVASPFLGGMFAAILFYVFFGRKLLKLRVLGWTLLVMLFGMILTIFNSPLVRPTTTDIPDQGIVKQLEAEAEQVGSVEDLVLQDATPVTEVRTKDEGKYVPKLSSDK